MKKLLLSTAICGLAFAAAPAYAEDGGVKLGLGGFYKGYLSYVDQDETPDDATTVGDQSESIRSLDWLQDTEVHFTGETTLDNGLTVGAHIEALADGGEFTSQEAYAYFSGPWGRVNAGAEDGAAYLLQVSAPSADANVDGLRQTINGVNYDAMNEADTATATFGSFVGMVIDQNFLTGQLVRNSSVAGQDVLASSTADVWLVNRGYGTFDYDNAITGYANKLTYLTPILNGFQAGFSFTPDVSYADNNANRFDEDSTYGNSYEVGARYEGQFNAVGVILGAGYAFSSLEAAETDLAYRDVNNNGAINVGTDEVVATTDDRQAWNVGGTLAFGPFGLGVTYLNDDMGVDGDAGRDTWAFGADYTTGPFKLGASYYMQSQEMFSSNEIDTDRYTGGIVYTYGPGMTFRGSVSYINHDSPVSYAEDGSATSVLLGTQINF